MKKRMQKLLILMASGAMLTANVVGTAVFAAEAETAAEAGTVDLIEAETAAETGVMDLAEAGAEGAALTEAAEEETEIETEAVYEEAQTMYMLDDAYVREAPDTSSEALAVAHRGESITVIGEIGAWYHVRIGGEDEAAAEEETGAAAEGAGVEGKAAAEDATKEEGTESVTAAVEAETEVTEGAGEEGVAAEAETEVAEDAENEGAAAEDATEEAEAAAENTATEAEVAAESGDVIEGYVAKKCISSDPAEAEAAVEAQEYAGGGTGSTVRYKRQI